MSDRRCVVLSVDGSPDGACADGSGWFDVAGTIVEGKASPATMPAMASAEERLLRTVMLKRMLRLRRRGSVRE